MLVYENECVGCSTIFHSCLGSACPYMNVPRWYCDRCGLEEDLYEFDDDEQLCMDCLKKEIKGFKLYIPGALKCEDCEGDYELVKYDGEILCMDCLLERFEQVSA